MRLWQKTRDTRDEIEIRDDADARSCISLPCILPRPTDEAISVSVKASISSDTNVTMTLTDAKWGSTYDGDGPPPGITKWLLLRAHLKQLVSLACQPASHSSASFHRTIVVPTLGI